MAANDPVADIAPSLQKARPAQEAMLQSHPLIERIMASVLGSFATLMAIRLSLISDIDLAMKWVLGVMAGLVVFAIIANRFRSDVVKDS